MPAQTASLQPDNRHNKIKHSGLIMKLAIRVKSVTLALATITTVSLLIISCKSKMSTHRGPVIFILFVVQQDFAPENRQLSFLWNESFHLWSKPSPSCLPLPPGSPSFNPSFKCPLQWQHTQSTHFWIMTTPHCNSVKYTLRQISFVFLMAPNLHHFHFQNRLLLHLLHL